MSERKPRPVRPFVSVALVALFLVLYLVRPDGAQAIHWWPLAVWTPVVFLPFLSLRFRPLLRPFGLVLILWLVALHLVREPSALAVLSPRAKAVDEFRVVSLNCAGGSVDAAKEAFSQSGDIVFLQEVGGREEFVRAAEAAGYRGVSWSVDDAVFARGSVTDPAKAMDFAAGTVELGGRRLRVVALRLLPPVFRLDLWSLDCWRNYASDSQARRTRLFELFEEARLKGPCLFGGDFNATNPRLVTDNRTDVTEAGRAVGRGWRGTGTNDFPFVWVDQIWASPEIHWAQAFVRKTENSDHRMVVADFRLD